MAKSQVVESVVWTVVSAVAAFALVSKTASVGVATIVVGGILVMSGGIAILLTWRLHD